MLLRRKSELGPRANLVDLVKCWMYKEAFPQGQNRNPDLACLRPVDGSIYGNCNRTGAISSLRGLRAESRHFFPENCIACSSELVAPHRTLPARELRVDLFLWPLELAGIKGKSDR